MECLPFACFGSVEPCLALPARNQSIAFKSAFRHVLFTFQNQKNTSCHLAIKFSICAEE